MPLFIRLLLYIFSRFGRLVLWEIIFILELQFAETQVFWVLGEIIFLNGRNFKKGCSRQGQRYRGNRALGGESNPEGREQSPAQNCALPFSLKTVPFHLTQRRTSPYSFQLNIYQKDFYILPLSQAAPQCGEAGYTSLSVLPCRAPLS